MLICCTPVCTLVTVSVICIIQGSFHIVYMSFLQSKYNCDANPSSIQALTYLTYLHDQSICNYSEINELLEKDHHVDVYYELPRTVKWARTVDDIAISYLVLDAFWIIFSFAMLAGALLKVRNKMSLFFYLPWCVVMAMLTCLDFFCTCLFGYHALCIKKPRDWLSIIGLDTDDEDTFYHLDLYVCKTGPLAALFVTTKFIGLMVLNTICMVQVCFFVWRTYRNII